MSSYVSVISENHKHSPPLCHHMYQLFQKITFTSIMSSYVSVISENHKHSPPLCHHMYQLFQKITFTSIMSPYVSVISENHKHSLPLCHHMYQLFQKIINIHFHDVIICISYFRKSQLHLFTDYTTLSCRQPFMH